MECFVGGIAPEIKTGLFTVPAGITETPVVLGKSPTAVFVEVPYGGNLVMATPSCTGRCQTDSSGSYIKVSTTSNGFSAYLSGVWGYPMTLGYMAIM